MRSPIARRGPAVGAGLHDPARQEADAAHARPGIAEKWTAFAGSRNIPYLGVAAHVGWIEKNRDAVPKLYPPTGRRRSGSWRNPDEAAKLIMPKGAAEDQKAMADLIRSNERLGLNVRWASEVRKEIESVYAAGKSIGFLGATRARRPSTRRQDERDRAAERRAPAHDARGAAAVIGRRSSCSPRSGRSRRSPFPSILFPSLADVSRTARDLRDWSQFAQVLATIGRILAGLVGAFVIGAALAPR